MRAKQNDRNSDVTETETEIDVTDPTGNVRKVTSDAQPYRLTYEQAGTPQKIDTSFTRDPTTNYATSIVDAP